VAVVCAGKAHHPQHLQKIRTDQDDAFSSGLSQPLAQMHKGQWLLREPADQLPRNGRTPDLQTLLNTADWPRVEWVSNHASADGEMVMSLLAGSSKAKRPLRGLVVAATGSGTISVGMENALIQARAVGVEVWVSSRCVWGQARFYEDKPYGVATSLNPAKAMVALSLSLLAGTR
jgi:L-asparaginase